MSHVILQYTVSQTEPMGWDGQARMGRYHVWQFLTDTVHHETFLTSQGHYKSAPEPTLAAESKLEIPLLAKRIR